jgi:hypothetical protein
MSLHIHATAISIGLALSFGIALPSPAVAQARGRGGQAAAQPAAERLHSVRRLNTAYRFTPPVRTVDALKRTMSRANIQRDLSTLLDQAGLSSVQAGVVRNLTDGTVTTTTIDPGTTMVWMAERRRGRPLIMRPTRWDGPRAFQAHQFEIDDRVNTYTFIVPLDCGNLSLLRQEPSRLAAREREDVARAEAARAASAKADADRAAAAKAEADRAAAAKAAADKAAAETAVAERAAAERAAADQRAEEARKADEARKAEAARVAAERKDLALRPFVAGFFGKQQRQYDQIDPAGLGAAVNPVRRYGDALAGAKIGVALRLGASQWSFNPGVVGFAGNLAEGTRTSGLVDLPIVYNFPNDMHFGSGVSFWDFTHSDIRTFTWLAEAGFPIWRNEARKHQLDVQVEWRQFFDRGSDPDTNYMFWGGLRYLFK